MSDAARLLQHFNGPVLAPAAQRIGDILLGRFAVPERLPNRAKKTPRAAARLQRLPLPRLPLVCRPTNRQTLLPPPKSPSDSEM